MENNYTQVHIFMLPVVFQDQLVCVLWVRLSWRRFGGVNIIDGGCTQML